MAITPILNPFAYERADNVTPDYTKSNPDNIANQETGFPLLQADDLSNPNATPVKEEEMNGILNFYTNILFKLGQGLQFTFDSALSTRLVGYPIGAILYCESNNTFQRSLIDNNTANFVTNPSYINDGIHWIDTSPLIVANNSARAYYTGNSNNITNPARTFAYVSEIPSITANSITRAYYTGGGSYIADPSKTFAYISELPNFANYINCKTLSLTNPQGEIRMHAIWNNATQKWHGTIGGAIYLTNVNNYSFELVLNLNTTLGFGQASGKGTLTYALQAGLTQLPVISQLNATINISESITNLYLLLTFLSPVDSSLLVEGYFTIEFVASSIS